MDTTPQTDATASTEPAVAAQPATSTPATTTPAAPSAAAAPNTQAAVRPATQQRPLIEPRDRFFHQSLGGSANARVKQDVGHGSFSTCFAKFQATMPLAVSTEQALFLTTAMNCVELTLLPQSRVLMVGAGGIGCELLKNLVLSGFGEVEIVDLDTIDLSNLNRQFLFRHEHIKKSKALVAKEAAHAFNPRVKIVAHHANIKDAQFNVKWFRGFDIVFNALDNLEARRHVNKMCLAADVSLIESGTTGFNGNVQVIKKGVTACYDCTEKPVAKSFPVCTIRSTPSQPIHCIVWGKSYLLSEVFGTSEDDAAYDHTADADNAEEIAELKKEAEALRKIRESLGTEAFPQLLFDKVFNSDVARLLSMEDMWKSRRKPEPLEYKKLVEQSTEALASKEQILRDDQRVWSLEENLAVFIDSLDRLSKRLLELKQAHQNASGPEPIITFDKDDDETLDFVTAAANIRSTVFGIDRKSKFDIKQMAGNIIPAIATTNAIVAGLCVLQAYKVLKGEYQQTKELFLAPTNLNRTMESTPFRPPNPNCPICGVYQTSVSVDMEKATLKDLVEDFVRLELGYGEKEFAVNNEAGPLYDPEETENLGKKLSELGIKADSSLTVIDEDDDNPFVNVVINIEESNDPAQTKPVQGPVADQKPQIPRKPKAEQPATNGVDVTPAKRPAEAENGVASSNKRGRNESEGGSPVAKKVKVADSGDDIIVIEDDAVISID